MQIEIIEVVKRSRQGVTRPFLCRAGNGIQYWVKGHDAGKQALCCEWLAGRLAQGLELPIAPFAQVHVPSELVENSAIEDIADLGTGIAFGSEHVAGADDLRLPQVEEVPFELRCRILMFDWWVQNEDRTLGNERQNVNLLWEHLAKKAWVIDHNLAFDTDFSAERFRRDHAFRECMGSMSSEVKFDFMAMMRQVMARLDSYYDELPTEWIEAAALSMDLSKERCRSVLERAVDANAFFGDDVK